MTIVKSRNKKTGILYAYESESYWDKEKKQPRSRRKLIGKVDEETGEIIPTGKRGRQPAAADPGAHSENEDYRLLYEQCRSELEDAQKEILELRQRIASAEISAGRMAAKLAEIRKLAEQ